jgi:hypothetical protein
MTKYTVAGRRRPMNEKVQVAPIWRGIGCIMILVVPVLSYIAAYFTVQLAVAQNWPMPYQIMGNPILPSVLMRSDALVPIVLFIEAQQNLYAILLLAIAYIVVFGGLLSFVYSIGYRMMGPPRYGPLDMPPAKGKVKRYTR